MEAYDIETYKNFKEEHVPYCVCFSFKNKFFSVYYEEGTDVVLRSFNLIFKLSFKKVYYYVHNLNFDGILMLNSLSKQSKYKYEFFARDKDIYEIKVMFLNKTVSVKCSFKLIPSSLNKIATSFNIGAKLLFPYDFITKERLFYDGVVPSSSFFKSVEDWKAFTLTNDGFNVREFSIKYCTNDVLLTKKFVTLFSNTVADLGINLKHEYSTPAISKKIFIKKFNKNKIKYSSNVFLDSFIRPGYFGGNCQVYGNPVEDEKVFHYDFSGMYAQCMTEKFPFGKYKPIKNNFDLNKQGFYWIEFKSNLEYPVLPHHSFNKKLMFTNGVIRGCYWFEEIQLFLNMGGEINKIFSGIEYQKYDYVFNDYVDYFTKMREKGGEFKTLGKLAVNSLYGSFGINPQQNYTFIIKKNEEDCLKKLNVIWKIDLNDIILVSASTDHALKKVLGFKPTKPQTNIAIAAAITSKARIKLYRAQQEVIKKKGRLLYSDTDSIFAAYKKDVSGERHGEIRWEATEKKIKDAFFMLPKAYGILYESSDEVIKIKGFNQKTPCFNDLKKNFYEDKILTIDDYIYLEKSDFVLKEKKLKKNFNISLYTKRVFTKDKKNTHPLTKIGDHYV